MLAEMSDDVQSRDPWHVEIDQCHVDFRATDDVDRFLSVARLGNSKTTTRKAFTDDLAKRRVVVSHEEIGDQHGHHRTRIG